jgi:hypothetical protein
MLSSQDGLRIDEEEKSYLGEGRGGTRALCHETVLIRVSD